MTMTARITIWATSKNVNCISKLHRSLSHSQEFDSFDKQGLQDRSKRDSEMAVSNTTHLQIVCNYNFFAI